MTQPNELEFIKYLSFPQIPREIIDKLEKNPEYHTDRPWSIDYFFRSDSYKEEIERWCKKNISQELQYGFQISTDDVPVHVDNRVFVKLFYLIQEGGNPVYTTYYNSDGDVLKQYRIPENQWVIFRADVDHSVTGMHPDGVRISLVAKLF